VRRQPFVLTAAAMAGLLAVFVAGSALAYFSTTGVGSASASVTKLTAPAITAATPAAGGTVSLTWSAAGAPGTGAVRYYVSRDGEAAEGTCPESSGPAAVTSCVDSGLEVGTHTYTVTAVWRSWHTTSSVSSAKVTVGPATHFAVVAATSAPAVSVADNLTVTAKDAGGSTVTTFTGSHSLVFSGASPSPGGEGPTVANSSGTAVPFGSATALTFTSGVASVTSTKNGVMKLYLAEAAEIAASEGGLETTSPPTVTATPAAASNFSLSGTSNTPVAGAADGLTITALDTYGNTATSYTGSKSLTFSGASASPDGTAPTVSSSAGTETAFGSATAISFSAGVATVSGVRNGAMKLYKVGATSVKATQGTIATSTALALTVAAGEASELTLSAATTTPVAAASDNLTATATDSYGNTATTYTGSHNLVFSGASASPSGAAPTVANSSGTAVAFGSATALTFTAGVASVTSTKNGVMKLSRAGATSVSAGDGSISTASPLALTVSVGTASRLGLTAVTASSGSLGSPCLFTCAVTGLAHGATISANVSVTDSVGNTVSALGTGHTVKVTATGGTIAGTPLTIASSGEAVSSTRLTYTAPASGTFTNTITAATSAGTVYTSATATASG
jgi:hypothetical protein